ncbi:MAG: Rrf2 family transcriptional regulator [Glaciecola sp.]
MQLTRYTDYGLRVLVYLALLPDGQRASIDKISDTYGISRNNVNKIVHQLGKEGIVLTKRGKGGGLSLAKHPNDIKIGDVVLVLENTLNAVECRSPACRILPVCKLKGILQEAMQSFIASLQQYSLNDLLVSNRGPLVTLLSLDHESV